MKILKFADNLVPLIISGEKTSTWRLFDDKNLKVDDSVIFVNKSTNQEFARAVIISIREKIIGEVEDDDFTGHERFESREAMLDTYRSYYGDKVTEVTPVKMIEFVILS